ncbi:MAG: glycosyltransferase family 9 protein [Acidobacteria bacterium]|nr:glycosyltransferase family 9 protein [Acidobacteriota bacterium]
MSSDPHILTSLHPQISRILLVRLREIGDVVFTTPAIRALRHKFPDARLTYIVEPAGAPVVALNPHLNDVIVAPRAGGLRGALDDLALGRRLRASRFDVAIDFHGGPRASLLTWLSGAPERIGYEIAARGWMYTTRVTRPRALRPRHSVENQWDLLVPLGIAPPDRASFPVEMASDPDAVAAVDARLSRAGVRAADALVVVHVSAGNPFRRWPLEHFVALIAALAAEDPARRIIVTAGPSEGDAADRVIAAARVRLQQSGGSKRTRPTNGDPRDQGRLQESGGSKRTRPTDPVGSDPIGSDPVGSDPVGSDHVGRVLPDRRSLGEGGSDPADRILSCGEFSLAELRALLDRAALYIGGDSGPLHIAATTRVPIVGLFGPTLPERSAPWRDERLACASVDAGPLPCRPCNQRVCEPGDFRCLTRITPDQVAGAAQRALATTTAGSAIPPTPSR